MSRPRAPVVAPRFFMSGPPVGGVVKLLEEERAHLEVLRLAAGDRCLGLDGQGGTWPLRIVRAGKRVELALEGEEPGTEPEPGSAGARLPWIEIAVAWPRKNRCEAMLGELVQLGAAAIVPVEARFRGPEPLPACPPARWQKLAREACKQSRRTWLPVLEGRATLEELCERPKGALALLDPDGGMSLDTWLRSLIPSLASLGTRERPIRVVVGPEGGLAPEEREALALAGGTPVRLGPHVLRIETAALAAMAVAATVLLGPLRP